MNASVTGPDRSYVPRNYDSDPFNYSGGSSNGGAGNLSSPNVNFKSVDHQPFKYGAAEDPATNPASKGNGGGPQDMQSLVAMLEQLLSLIKDLFQGGGGGDAGDSSKGSGNGMPSGGSPGNSFASTPPAQDNPPVSSDSAVPQAKATADAPTTGDKPAVQTGDDTKTASAGNAPSGMPQSLWQDCVKAGDKHGVDPYVLAAQAKQETQWGSDTSGSSGGDGVMQVEPNTRAAYADQFRQQAGHDYDHSSQSDQVEMAAVIMGSKGGDTANQLQKYNGGDNWAPGATDSYGRTIEADKYASNVQKIAEDLRNSA